MSHCPSPPPLSLLRGNSTPQRPRPAPPPQHRQCLTHIDTVVSDKSDLLTFDPASSLRGPSCWGGRSSTVMPLSCRAMDPKAAGASCRLSPKNEALKADGDKKDVGVDGGRAGVVTHPQSGAPASAACLGRQRVVVTFAALALAAQDDGRGQEEEGGGDQQEQAEPGEDPHHLQGDGRRQCSPKLWRT